MARVNNSRADRLLRAFYSVFLPVFLLLIYLSIVLVLVTAGSMLAATPLLVCFAIVARMVRWCLLVTFTTPEAGTLQPEIEPPLEVFFRLLGKLLPRPPSLTDGSMQARQDSSG